MTHTGFTFVGKIAPLVEEITALVDKFMNMNKARFYKTAKRYVKNTLRVITSPSTPQRTLVEKLHRHEPGLSKGPEKSHNHSQARFYEPLGPVSRYSPKNYC